MDEVIPEVDFSSHDDISALVADLVDLNKTERSFIFDKNNEGKYHNQTIENGLAKKVKTKKQSRIKAVKKLQSNKQIKSKKAAKRQEKLEKKKHKKLFMPVTHQKGAGQHKLDQGVLSSLLDVIYNVLASLPFIPKGFLNFISR